MEQPDAPIPNEVQEVVRQGTPPQVPLDVFLTVFESSFGISVVADGDGDIQALSDAAADLYPSRAAALGTALADAPWWEDGARVHESLRLARRGMLDRFTAGVTRTGSRRTLLVDVQSVGGPDGEVWFLLEARDVTTLMASERHLHDAHADLERERAQLVAVLDATPDAIAAVDAQGVVTTVNRAVRDSGLASDQRLAVGDSVLEGGTWSALWRRALGGETVRQRVARPASETHPAQWLDLTVAPVRAGGHVRGAVLAATDATALVEGEQIHLAVGRGAVGTFQMDGDGRLVLASPSFRALLGCPTSQTLSQITAGLDHPAEVEAAVAAVLAGPGRTLDLRATSAAGATSVWLRGRSVASQDGVRLVGVAYDTTPPADAQAGDRWADLVARGGWGTGPADRVDDGVLAPPPDPAVVAARLDALRRTGLLTGGRSQSLDALTELVSQALGVPVSLVSLVDSDRQVFKGRAGVDVDETPLTHSFCQHVANERRPLVVPDARSSARVRDNLAIPELGVAAYLGVPIAAPDGHVIGALCAIDTVPHEWSDDDVRLLSSLAEAVTAEVASQSPPASPDA